MFLGYTLDWFVEVGVVATTTATPSTMDTGTKVHLRVLPFVDLRPWSFGKKGTVLIILGELGGWNDLGIL